MKTTFAKIKSFSLGLDRWEKILDYHKPSSLDEEITIKEILESNGIKDAVWALRAVENQDKVRLFCADIAESVLHIFEEKFPDDNRPRKAIEAIRKFVNKEITKEELKTSAAAALDAADAALAVYAADAAFVAGAAIIATEAGAAAKEAATYVAAAVITDVVIDDANAAADDDAVIDAAKIKKWKEIEEILLKYIN